MSTVLIAGLCPLPFENTRRNYGPGIRSWQFARSLAEAGHDVHLVAMIIPGVYGDSELDRRGRRDGVEIERVSESRFMEPRFLRTRIREIAPDAVVGATVYGSFALAQTEPAIPFWADQFGHVMAEAQAKAALDESNDVLPYFWRMVIPVDRRADRISTVSERQRYALLGELGALGRLTAESCGYEFTSVIPCALVPEDSIARRSTPPGPTLPDDAFTVLWSGSYNVWSDVETVYLALEAAMAADDRIHFVSTGGAIEGHDTETYARFRSLVERSSQRSRFHLQGWLRHDRVPSYVADADLGILAERSIYEGELGSKNRLVQWMGQGLAVAYNRVGDLGELLEEEGLGLTFWPEDHEQLADAILWAAANPEAMAKMVERARDLAHERFSFAATTAPLVEWCADPRRAPDAGVAQTVLSPADFTTRRQGVVQTVDRATGGRAGWLKRSWARLFALFGS